MGLKDYADCFLLFENVNVGLKQMIDFETETETKVSFSA